MPDGSSRVISDDNLSTTPLYPTTTETTTTTTTTTTAVEKCFDTVQSNQIESVEASSIYQGRTLDYGPKFAVDGHVSKTITEFFHSQEERRPWLQLTFTTPFIVTGVEITNRASGSPATYESLKNLEVRIGSKALTKSGEVSTNPLCGIFKGPSTSLAVEQVPCQAPLKGKYLSVQFQDEQADRSMNINEISISCTTQVDTCFDGVRSYQIESVTASTVLRGEMERRGPQLAIDGKISEATDYFYHSEKERQPWLQLTFTTPFIVIGMELTNRNGDSCNRLRNLEVRIGFQALTKSGEVSTNPLCGIFEGPSTALAKEEISCQMPLEGKHILVQLQDEQAARYLSINEIEVTCSVTTSPGK